MKKDGKWTRVHETRHCDLCAEKGETKTARYDGKTGFGPWANMCPVCHQMFGVGLGAGRGQVLLYPNEQICQGCGSIEYVKPECHDKVCTQCGRWVSTGCALTDEEFHTHGKGAHV